MVQWLGLLTSTAGGKNSIPGQTAKVPSCACMHTCCRSVVSDSFSTPWTAARQAPLSMGFSRQEDWSALPCLPPPGDLPNPGIEPVSLMSPALAGGFFTTSNTWEAPVMLHNKQRSK